MRPSLLFELQHFWWEFYFAAIVGVILKEAKFLENVDGHKQIAGSS